MTMLTELRVGINPHDAPTTDEISARVRDTKDSELARSWNPVSNAVYSPTWEVRPSLMDFLDFLEKRRGKLIAPRGVGRASRPN